MFVYQRLAATREAVRPLASDGVAHGGGNHGLQARERQLRWRRVYNGEHLVPHGVVFVSYNLRVGVSRFPVARRAQCGTSERISGNYGSLDQIAMLQWINRNIAAFGGDASRVFLFGTSAGGGNICALMTSPLTRGLIHGVAMQSSVPAGCEIKTLAEDENDTGRRVAKAAGCDTAPDIAACLRGKSATEIVKAVPGAFSVFARIYGPNMDGHVFPEQPIKTIAAQRHPAMPIIIGGTSRETWGWSSMVNDEASYVAAIDKLFGARRARSYSQNLPDDRVSIGACCFRASDHGRPIHLPGPPGRPHHFEGAERAGLSLRVRSRARKRSAA